MGWRHGVKAKREMGAQAPRWIQVPMVAALLAMTALVLLGTGLAWAVPDEATGSGAASPAAASTDSGAAAVSDGPTASASPTAGEDGIAAAEGAAGNVPGSSAAQPGEAEGDPEDKDDAPVGDDPRAEGVSEVIEGQGEEGSRAVHYTLVFEGHGGQGSMEPLSVTLQRGCTVRTVLPANGFQRPGFTFGGWYAKVPEFTYLDPVVVPDCQQFLNLGWESDQAPAGWEGPLTLHSFADQQGRITLTALWQDDATGEWDGGDLGGGEDGPGISPLTSSTAKRTLYLFKNGQHGYLTTATTAPAGFGSRTAVLIIPRSSATPVYASQHYEYPQCWSFTMDVAEYNRNGTIGWVKKGAAFYADDAQGVPLYRFLKNGVPVTHAWSTGTAMSGFVREGVGVYGLKYYNIAYNGNGATGGSTATQTNLQYGLSYNLRANGFTRTDHSFTGWLGPDGKRYGNGQSVTSLCSQAGGTVTLKAQWARSHYYVRFDPGGGAGSMATQRLAAGSAYKAPVPCYTRAGYQFVEWNTRSDGKGTAYKAGASLKMGADLTLYAQWKALQLTFTTPSSVSLSMDYAGNITGPAASALTLKNTSAVGLRLQGIKVSQGSDLKLVESPASSGEVGLTFHRAGSTPVALSSYVGSDYKAVPGVAASVIGSGKSVALGSLDGRCAGVPAAARWPASLGAMSWKTALATATLTYSPNCSGASSRSQVGNVGDTVAAAPSLFTNGSRAFRGWNTKADGTGAVYSPGQSLTLGGSLVLYAQWG